MTIPAALYTSDMNARIDAMERQITRNALMLNIAIIAFEFDDNDETDAYRRLARVDGLVWC